MQNSFSIVLMNWSDALPLARAVREMVFVEEQGVPRELGGTTGTDGQTTPWRWMADPMR